MDCGRYGVGCEVWWSGVYEVRGGVLLKNVKTGKEQKVECEGVFIAIGFHPNTGLFKGQIDLDKKGYIILRNESETSVEGVFAAGDVHDTRYRQAITAAGSGCKAAIDAVKYLEMKV